MQSQDNNNESQRFKPYRAVIPFYILYDLDLNANHLRLYGQIEQMESNPDPKVSAAFSYSWLGDQLKINRRNAMKMAKVLIEKGYIEHTEIKKGKYIWNTKKKPVIIDDSSEQCLTETPDQCLPETPPSVSQGHPKIPEVKIPKDKKRYIPPKDSFGLIQMLEDNPHSIPEYMIVDWLEVRRVKKAKITLTAWNATNSILKNLADRGLNAVECFEHMVARGWQGIKLSYFQDELNALTLSPGQLTKEQRAANELKTKERELKAQEEKRKEIDAARNLGNVIGTIRTTMGFTEATKKADEEAKRLGISPHEYHTQVLRQARAG